MIKKAIGYLLSLLFGVFYSCSGLSTYVDPNILANDYLTTHPKFLEKYGEDYTLEYTGGGGVKEIGGRNGVSGTDSYNCTINGTDQYSVALVKEKDHPWTVQGVVCLSAQHACNELNLVFWPQENDKLESTEVNGVLYLNGKKIDVIVWLVSCRMVVLDAELYRQEREAMAKVEPNRIDLPQDQLDICTILACSIIGDFDMFTATPEPGYEDFSSVKEYHFYVTEDVQRS